MRRNNGELTFRCKFCTAARNTTHWPHPTALMHFAPQLALLENVTKIDCARYRGKALFEARRQGTLVARSARSFMSCACSFSRPLTKITTVTSSLQSDT